MGIEHDDLPFTPDWVVRPGDHIQEAMEYAGLRKLQVAEACGISLAHFEDLLISAQPLTDEIAEKLAVVMAVEGRRPLPDYWKALEANYREGRKRTGKIL